MIGREEGPVPRRPGGPEIVCLGESMTMLAATTQAPLRTRPNLAMYVGGAESNVACGLAHLGHHVEWVGRVGADPFGRGIVDFLQSRSVGTRRVAYDEGRQTGVYFKDRVGVRTVVYYYRANSAASAMSREDVDPRIFGAAHLVHLSGITPALSASCDDLMQALVVERLHGGAPVSFDVNYRPALWPVAEAAPRLRELAAAADIVVVGRDEAEGLWRTAHPADVRALFPDVEQLVVKDNEVGATLFAGDEVVFQPALRANVVEPVGAGDAFAAGFLSAWLQGMPLDRRLRHGHVIAALTLKHESDLPSLPAPDAIAAWSALEGAAWTGLDLDVAQPPPRPAN
jgi:2-dehydro-3-deoxygluconokinase